MRSLRTVGVAGIGSRMSIIASQAALNRGGRRCRPIDRRDELATESRNPEESRTLYLMLWV